MKNAYNSVNNADKSLLSDSERIVFSRNDLKCSSASVIVSGSLLSNNPLR